MPKSRNCLPGLAALLCLGDRPFNRDDDYCRSGPSGSVKTTGVEGVAAHIHVGSTGKNGPVIIPLTKGADGEWSVPPNAKLNGEQMKSFRAGDLYVNVHSESNQGGEIRAQLTP